MISTSAMTRRIPRALFASLLLAAFGAAHAQVPASAPGTCAYDRIRLLALDRLEFDQDMSGGWRPLAAKPGCALAAADLLRDYRQAHADEDGMLYWHEGQMRANAGRYEEAIPLLEHARKPPGTPDKAGWNPYVDATVAFLRRDRAALERARATLAAYPPPTGEGVPEVKDGYLVLDMDGGKQRRVRWPLNIEVVECLEKSFDKPYTDAYSNDCKMK